MIIEVIFSGVLALFIEILDFLPTDLIPNEFLLLIDDLIRYISDGAKIVAFYFPDGYLQGVFSFLLNFYFIYFQVCFVKRIISLIPLLQSFDE